MGWKEWPMWVKGGVIFGGGVSILFIGGIILVDALSSRWGYDLTHLIMPGIDILNRLPLVLAKAITPLFCHERGWFDCIAPFVYLDFFFLLVELIIIGAIIGWIVGKVKEKKEVTLS